MTDYIKKMENDTRVAELNPKKTLLRVGVSSDSVVLDYGSGSGVFSIPAASMTKESVYAFDLNTEVLDYLDNKVKEANIENLITLKGREELDKIADESIDKIILSTVYHHFDDVEIFFEDINRLLKKDGNVVVIEFHNHETPMGPPVEMRYSKEALVNDFTLHGFDAKMGFTLGENMHCVVFEKVFE